MALERRLLVGNRLTLAGVILYLLEWIGILTFGTGTAPTNPGTSPREVVAEYTQHANAIALLGGWLALVLLGRILFYRRYPRGAAPFRGADPSS